jgi:hypothetical protein
LKPQSHPPIQKEERERKKEITYIYMFKTRREALKGQKQCKQRNHSSGPASKQKASKPRVTEKGMTTEKLLNFNNHQENVNDLKTSVLTITVEKWTRCDTIKYCQIHRETAAGKNVNGNNIVTQWSPNFP